MDPNIDSPKRPDMVMCGDHPSFAKTDLNAKAPGEGKEAPATPPRAALSSASVRAERAPQPPCARASGHELRARRPERGVGQRGALVQGTTGATTLHLKAALGSFRWPPYLVAVWVVVLVLTHALHCFVGLLERALPRLRELCQCLRAATERSWHAAGARPCPAALGALTCASYVTYCALCTLHAVALWAVEPLAPDRRDSTSRVTDYEDATGSDDSFK